MDVCAGCCVVSCGRLDCWCGDVLGLFYRARYPRRFRSSRPGFLFVVMGELLLLFAAFVGVPYYLLSAEGRDPFVSPRPGWLW